MLKILLYPLSWLYGIAVFARNQMYDLNILKSKEFNVPVISVGNITVGGTGKTPHVEYLADLLQKKFEVATLSRGYKRDTKGFRYVKTSSKVADVGDEPLQIKNKFPKVRVCVCEDRVIGVEKLLQPAAAKIPNVVLLDDAYQHRRITPGMNILLIDYNRQMRKDSLLPAGRLRESSSQMSRAHIIIYTKCPDKLTRMMLRNLLNNANLQPYQKIYFTTLDYQKIIPVFSAKKLEDDFYEKKTYSSLIVTGVARPKPMYKYLDQFLKKIETLEYHDHHNFTKDDITSIMQKFDELLSRKKIIITTEKDAVRLKEMDDLPDKFKDVLYYLPIKVSFLEGEGKSFDDKILNYVGQNKSYS
jgi:tetraacyldisaccharide 4'-kinase